MQDHTLRQRFHGFKGFLLEILIITVGLLIALGLNDTVDGWHHRSLVHAAESSLRNEIEKNSITLADIRKQIRTEQEKLDNNLAVLSRLRASNAPRTAKDTLSFEFKIEGFDDTAWKTSQAAAALTYMPYADVEEFSNIYDNQNEVYGVQREAINDVLSAAALVVTKSRSEKLTSTEIDTVTDRIGLAKMRLIFLSSLVDSLDSNYRNYKADHL